jgi:transglutaminase-like putative cysteine protease
MKLRVEHTTTFEYDLPIYEMATEMRLQPSDESAQNQFKDVQECLSFSLRVDPQPTNIFHYTDFYGNEVHHFNLLQSHQRLQIVATCLVDTPMSNKSPHFFDDIFLTDYLRESVYVEFAPAVKEFAKQFDPSLDPPILAEIIARKINESFIYETGVTDAYSTTSHVMELGRGVCQDFAHVMIATCRFLGLPARYVSGYLYGGFDTEHFDRASHAWCEIFSTKDRAWISFDPTHENILVNENYIKIGTGRDYSDVTLVRGTFKGNAKESLDVVVRVTAV